MLLRAISKALFLIFSRLDLMTPQNAKALPLKTLRGSEQILRLAPYEENLEERVNVPNLHLLK